MRVADLIWAMVSRTSSFLGRDSYLTKNVEVATTLFGSNGVREFTRRLDGLPVEIVGVICSFLSYAECMRLARLGILPSGMKTLDMFSRDILGMEWAAMRRILEEGKAFIGGSAALLFFSHDFGAPGDVDIFTRRLSASEKALQKEGYVLQSVPEGWPTGDNMYPRRVRVSTYLKGTRKVQLIAEFKTHTDNTANGCMLYHDIAVCPYHNEVRDRRVTFTPYAKPTRHEKYAKRGFAVVVAEEADPDDMWDDNGWYREAEIKQFVERNELVVPL
jgi:hypothetical protein